MTETCTASDLFDLPVHGSTLLTLAAGSVRYAVTHGCPKQIKLGDYPEALRAPGATFVTLKKSGTLRGCIGSLEASNPLVIDIAENAHGAALCDSRFAPVTANDLVDLDVSLSILGPLSALPFSDETNLTNELRSGHDGVVIAGGGKRSTFLPQVWHDLPEPKVFLDALKRKGGFAGELTPQDHQVWRYHVTDIGPIGLDSC